MTPPYGTDRGLAALTAGIVALEARIQQVFVGKQQVVRRSLTSFLAGGHLLIEDVPGRGENHHAGAQSG